MKIGNITSIIPFLKPEKLFICLNCLGKDCIFVAVKNSMKGKQLQSLIMAVCFTINAAQKMSRIARLIYHCAFIVANGSMFLS